MGIKKKIMLGFVVIGFILLLSSLISVFELSRIRNSVSALLAENVKSINASRQLLDTTDNQIFNILNQMGRDTEPHLPDAAERNRFYFFLEESRDSFKSLQEKRMADTIMYAYATYLQVMNEAPAVWIKGYETRRTWYFDRFHPVYLRLRHYIQQLTEITQEELAENSYNIDAGFYRSIMPGIIAVAAGIVLVFLFNYFVNIYFIDPVLSISRGIRDYEKYRKRYSVQVTNGDELTELNDSVKTILEEHKSFLMQNKN